ncbi:MAG TPA: CPBP family intramembrane glutamic endopeptidase [Bacteroidales bacterium]|nr:CPBP family intramembrane glutamic endopeptidase [Bacteroidales bacterium]
MTRRILLLLEMLVIFVILPTLFFIGSIPGPKILTLFIVVAYCLVILLLDKGFDRSVLLTFTNKGLRPILFRFGVVAILLILYVALFEPENLFFLPRNKPLLWVMIIVFYPLWSALPQELIFRVFFLHRYNILFNKNITFLIINALAFAYLHIIFNNWIAVAGSFVAGLFLAHTYLHNRSLFRVTIEHALYGNTIFTVGLGHYFYLPDN